MFQGSHVPKLKDGVRLIIHRRLPKDSRIGNVTFSLDTDSRIFASVEYRYSLRKKRHSLDEYRINGKAVSFRMASPGEMKGSFDLVIVATKYNALEKEGYVSGNSIPKISFPASESVFKKTYPYLKEADSLGLMDDPGTYSQPPHAGGSKDESGTAAKDTISIGSGDRVSGADRMGMEVH